MVTALVAKIDQRHLSLNPLDRSPHLVEAGEMGRLVGQIDFGERP